MLFRIGLGVTMARLGMGIPRVAVVLAVGGAGMFVCVRAWMVPRRNGDEPLIQGLR